MTDLDLDEVRRIAADGDRYRRTGAILLLADEVEQLRGQVVLHERDEAERRLEASVELARRNELDRHMGDVTFTWVLILMALAFLCGVSLPMGAVAVSITCIAWAIRA